VWRVALIAVVVGIAALTAIAFHRRAYAGLELASFFCLLSGIDILLILYLASELSWGESDLNVLREARWVLPLGLAMVIGGLALGRWARDQRYPNRRDQKHA
jgi:hypothetical protein